MIHGPLLLIIFIAAIAFIIIMTAKVKMNAFLVLLLAAFGVGILSGMEPVSVIQTMPIRLCSLARTYLVRSKATQGIILHHLRSSRDIRQQVDIPNDIFCPAIRPLYEPL